MPRVELNGWLAGKIAKDKFAAIRPNNAEVLKTHFSQMDLDDFYARLSRNLNRKRGLAFNGAGELSLAAAAVLRARSAASPCS